VTRPAPAKASPPVVVNPVLVVQDGPLAGQRFEVRGEVTLGREGADVVIADGEVSRRHARVVRAGDRLEVVDERSANGTYVNGVRIEGRATVANGDVVRIGQTSIEIEVPAAPPSPRDAATVVTARTKRRSPSQ
jgi:pSer/pThr/pTyr-binding forkhead associated (FHA) protein